MANSYKLAKDNVKVGFKGVRLSNDNLASFSERLLNIWLKAGIIKQIKNSTKSKENDSSGTSESSSRKGSGAKGN